MSEYTPEQIEEMRAAVAAADRAMAEHLAALRAAYYQPLKTLTESEAWSTVYTALASAKDTFAEDQFFSVHVRALAEIMPRLVENVELYVLLDPLPEEPEDEGSGE